MVEKCTFRKKAEDNSLSLYDLLFIQLRWLRQYIEQKDYKQEEAKIAPIWKEIICIHERADANEEAREFVYDQLVQSREKSNDLCLNRLYNFKNR